MTFASRMTRTPIPFDPVVGEDVASQVRLDDPQMRALIAGAAGSSHYLAELIRREADWLADLPAAAPEALLDAALDMPPSDSRTSLMRDLRVAKRRVALLAALADLSGVWGLEEVTGALTRLADRAVDRAIAFLVAEARGRGRLPEGDTDYGGLVVLAMGKMGAFELNYSSDIDLIVLFDETRYPEHDYSEIRQAFIRITQAMVRVLADATEDGYVFRTDLRLRPDPSVTPVCIGIGAAERYYEAQGRTWERAAMIKARACAGDIAAGEAFLRDIAPFIWRRHLDFAAIQDAHDMRLKIRAHKGLGGPISLPGHDVKLGRGGIREIEFFTQTRQLICGGREAGLRLSQTKPALDALAAGGWVGAELAAEFKAAYSAHRELEHRIQMLEDAQTHAYPKSQEARARVSHLCGEADLAAFEAGLTARFQQVHERVESFFVAERPEAAEGAIWAGFADAKAAAEMAEAWHALPALRSDRSRAIFERLAPGLARRLSEAAIPEQALSEFDKFLRGLPAGVQVFSLFEANPQILDLLVEICAAAPKLAEYLGRAPQVLDAVLSQAFFQPMEPLEALCADVAGPLGAAADYEAQLDAARIWVHEQNFRVGVHLLRDLCRPEEAARAYSDIAEAALRALVPAVEAHFAVRHGHVAGGAFAVIGMGKMGSREMTASSDLDLITIYDAPDQAVSDGVKDLPAKTYYARLTQALINALTAPTAQGVLYAVDMRLRPSGRKGPVATSLAGFRAYQRDEAWTWEHLALTRARVVAGPEALSAAIEAAIVEALEAPGDPAKIRSDMVEMRARLGAAKAGAADDGWELKQGPGRMLDVEMLLQGGRLIHPQIRARSPRQMIPDLVGAGYLSDGQGRDLDEALGLLATVQQIGRLALAEGFSPQKAGRGLAQVLTRATGTESLEDLEAQLAAAAARAAGIVSDSLGPESS